MQRQIKLCGALEARLELAQKVLAYCKYNLQLTMQIWIGAAQHVDQLLAKRADNSAEISCLIQQLREQLESQDEKQLLDAASPRWSFAETYGELLRRIVDGHGSPEAGEETPNILLPILLDNASWEAFVELLRAQLRLADLGDRPQEQLVTRTRELVRQNQVLKSIVAERKRLQERISQLSSVIDSANDAIVIYTIGGTIVSWNHAAERLYGYSAAEVLGRSKYMLTGADKPGQSDGMRDKANLQRELGIRDAIHMRKDGSPIRVSMSLSPVKDVSGNTVGIAAITRESGSHKPASSEPASPTKRSA